jgi:hypothetical protein
MIHTETEEWEVNSNLNLGKKWCHTLKSFSNENTYLENLLLLAEFAFALSGTNADVERVFSIMNALLVLLRAHVCYLMMLSIAKFTCKSYYCHNRRYDCHHCRHCHRCHHHHHHHHQSHMIHCSVCN